LFSSATATTSPPERSGRSASIRVIGFDGVRATDYLELSTVSQEPQMIGELASTLIIDLIEGKGSGGLIHRVITPVLIDRGS
jgi:DNA-binding LacI/PurR family transcriptional regulator